MAEIKEAIENYGLNKKNKSNAMFSKVGVVGCGQDGSAIVSMIASAGIDVVFIEVSEERIDFGRERIAKGLDTKIQNWGLTSSEKKAIMDRIKGSQNYEDLKDCDFVVECIRYEQNGEKSTNMRKEVFKKLEEVLSPEAIIATNGATVVISELAAGLKYKDRCISVHFCLPYVDTNLLEIARGLFTSEEVAKKVEIFAQMIKVVPIRVKESTGLVNMRLLCVMLNEACSVLLEGISSMEDIDKQFTVQLGQHFGIFTLADMSGIEKLVMLMEDMFHDFGDKKYKANPILWRLYRSGQHGVKTGSGFYMYDEEGNKLGVNKSIL